MHQFITRVVRAHVGEETSRYGFIYTRTGISILESAVGEPSIFRNQNHHVQAINPATGQPYPRYRPYGLALWRMNRGIGRAPHPGAFMLWRHSHEGPEPAIARGISEMAERAFQWSVGNVGHSLSAPWIQTPAEIRRLAAAWLVFARPIYIPAIDLTLALPELNGMLQERFLRGWPTYFLAYIKDRHYWVRYHPPTAANPDRVVQAIQGMLEGCAKNRLLNFLS